MNKVDFTIAREMNVVSFDISGIRIVLFEKAIISVVFRCDNGESIYKEVVLMGDAYLRWSDNDDNYIINYIKKNIYDILDE